MRNKRLLALSMALVLIVQSPLTHLHVNAIEVVDQSDGMAEYVVQVDCEEEFEQVAEDNEVAVVEEESVLELAEENIVVLELTDEEVEELEENKNIVVEENILFTANTMESSELVLEENPSVTEEVTEGVSEMTEETASVEIATSEESKKDNKKTKKSKKEKESKKDKSKKDKLDGEEQAEKRAKFESKKNEKTGETEQWNLEAIHYSDGEENKDTVKVALLDSGVSFDEDIHVSERITINENNEVENALFDDATGHGTSMAGIIVAQDNEDGIKGINPNAELYSIQILDENNQSTLGQVIAGIYKAIELDCDIINMSFGTTVDSQLLHDAIKEADKNGILMIAAAGNTDGGAVEYPAAYNEVLAVGASDTTGNKLTGSSDGAEIEIFAPGDQIVSAGLFGGNIVLRGTSIAAAQVTGAASLLWSIDKEKSAGFIRSLMINTAQTMDDNGMSNGGLLDIENAVAQYNDLEYTYEENNLEYEELQEEARDAEEFLDVKLVNGMWSRDAHASMSNNAATYYNISATNIQLMAQAARNADDYKKNNLHASGNYVKVLKFLYQCAWYLREGDTVDTAISKADAETGLSKTEKGPTTIADVRSLLTGDDKAKKEVRYYKVLGFAMHLVGDTYAHRTIVPKYTVKGTNPTKAKYSTSATSEDARFGTEDFKATGSHTRHSDQTLKEWALKSYAKRDSICKRWNCFQRAVNLGVVEFKDIKNFATKKAYEDDSKFCRERYEDAVLCCEVLLEYFYEKCEYDGVYILFPTEKNVKLNNFKNYAVSAGQDISILTAQEWENMSTPKEY